MFAKRLKRGRELMGITQRELGELLGVTDRAVGLWESGKRIPNTDMLKKIADLFDCTVDYLLGHTNERKPYSDTDIDPEKAEILNRAKDLSPEAWEQFRRAVEWVFEIDKDREEVERLKKKARKDLGH